MIKCFRLSFPTSNDLTVIEVGLAIRMLLSSLTVLQSSICYRGPIYIQVSYSNMVVWLCFGHSEVHY